MPPRRLNVKRLSRLSRDGREEFLEFVPGVNVLVGLPNTGKTSWLQLLDYLFGDPDPVEKALGTAIAAKYNSASVALRVHEQELIIERQWGSDGPKSKVFINGEAIGTDEFSDVFLPRLGIPNLRIPKGNPYAPGAWSRLSWRMLYRHIYRQENSWGDLAVQQPVAEQQACLMMFLGLAEKLFPNAYGKLVERQRELLALQARKDQFTDALHDVSQELTSLAEVRIATTLDSLDEARRRIAAELIARENDREDLLTGLRDRTEQRLHAEESARRSALSVLGVRLAELRARRNRLVDRIAVARQHRSELSRHRLVVTDELAKLERMKVAQEELADLRITHCPNCDQAINRSPEPDRCVLCLQSYPGGDAGDRATAQRLEFEVHQLAAEATELDDLLGQIGAELEAEERQRRDFEDEIHRIESELKPAYSIAAWLLPPELSIIDQERGRLAEQLRQIDRIAAALSRRDTLSERIDEISREIEQLNADVSAMASEADFSLSSDVLADGMNSYLNALNAGGEPRWRGERVSVRLRDRGFKLQVGSQDWKSEVGATYACYFLAAYNYALLRLSALPTAEYPGFAAIDLPPNISDFRGLTDQENYLVEPFISLLARPEMSGTQLIITGHAYQGLGGVNRIALAEVFDAA